MKTLNITAIALAATLMIAGTASATPLTSYIGTNSSNVRVVFTDDVASIYGSVDELIEKSLVEQEVAKHHGVDEVKNFLSVNK